MTDANASTPPVRPYQEAAKTQAVSCLSCGGPLQLHGFAAIERVICPYCGSELAPEDSGGLKLLAAAQRAHRPSILQLHRRGNIDGVEWEIIGIQWRSATPNSSEGTWQEFLLFNPYSGYRWLIYSPDERAFSIADALDGIPEFSPGRAQFKGKRYRFYLGYRAVVQYVEGEFPWQVRVGDTTQCDDYAAAPDGLSIEYVFDEHGRASEMTASRTKWLEAETVYAIFGESGRPPKVRGMPALAPNPIDPKWNSVWKVAPILIGLWILLGVLNAALHPKRTAFENISDVEITAGQGELINTPIEFEGAWGSSNVAFDFAIEGLEDSWAAAQFTLAPVGVGSTSDALYG